MENTSEKPEIKRKRGCGSCLLGCFIFGLVTILIIFVLGLVLPPILRYFDLLRPDVREVYGAAPDLAASEDITQVFLDLNITGVEALVIPSQQGGQAAIITMNETKGFGGIAGPGFDQIVDGLVLANQSGEYEIEYFSMIYIGEEGTELFTMATDRESLQAYSEGRISRSELMGNTGIDVGSFLDALDFSGELGN
jgi:hypothetical protein